MSSEHRKPAGASPSSRRCDSGDSRDPATSSARRSEPDAPAAHDAPAGNAKHVDADASASEGLAPRAEAGGADPHARRPEEADASADLEPDLEQLSAKAAKADEYLELAQRTRADFENFRKRANREAAAAQERGIAKLARELLPAVDDLDRALAAARASGDGGELAAGIELVHADVIAALARVGIEPYSPEGERFDPEHHEAIAQQPFEGAEPGTVIEVYQRGYRLGELVLRPARVVVAG